MEKQIRDPCSNCVKYKVCLERRGICKDFIRKEVKSDVRKSRSTGE